MQTAQLIYWAVAEQILAREISTARNYLKLLKASDSSS
jgi:hypothetical protein